MTKRPAVFLDRDGTLVRDAHFLSDPAKVELLAGVGTALRRFRGAGFELVVVTNQSGIARGLMTESDYEAVRRRLDVLLAEKEIQLTATYHCPHHPDVSGDCECRKPGTALHRRAAEEHDLDLARSVFVGDRWRDVAPAIALGGRRFLVPNANTPDAEIAQARSEAQVLASLGDVAALVAGEHAG
ncbi:MAG: HAD family hydrolase [Gemmatimonadaceae bacterium]